MSEVDHYAEMRKRSAQLRKVGKKYRITPSSWDMIPAAARAAAEARKVAATSAAAENYNLPPHEPHEMFDMTLFRNKDYLARPQHE